MPLLLYPLLVRECLHLSRTLTTASQKGGETPSVFSIVQAIEDNSESWNRCRGAASPSIWETGRLAKLSNHHTEPCVCLVGL